MPESREIELGKKISGQLCDKYGVVQDAAVTKYVSLVGQTLTTVSDRPKLPWTFIVLDTPGVNAFAAPGGYVHITRGALALIQNEGELADVLGHEVSHITQKHTVKAIERANVEGAGAKATGPIGQKLVDFGYHKVLENDFSRDEEEDADAHGIALASKAGYSAGGLNAFLTRLDDRSKGLKEKSGMFASHPDTQDRIDKMTKSIKSERLDGVALVAARYARNISYKPESIPGITVQASSGNKVGLGGLTGLGKENSGNQTIAAGGSRGVNPDRDAPGGPIKTVVAVTVTAAELAEFKKGITG
jgi:beta-barrel assembly-enhancing protease